MLRATGLTHDVTVPVSAGLVTDMAATSPQWRHTDQGMCSPIIDTLSHAALSAVENGGRL
ncbi:hypothetical protein [Gordonia sp. NPDC003376]